MTSTSSIREILSELGYSISSESQTHYKMRALYREGDNNTALSVNKKTGWYTDFATGESGPIEKLVKLTSGKTISFKKEEISLIENIQDSLPIIFNKEEITALLPSYTFYNKRGISSDTLKKFEGGVCTYGEMNNRFVFPIKNIKGEIVGLAGRDLLDSDKRPKWKIKGKKTTWDYPSYYNKVSTIVSKQIILIEGISDMLALYEAGIKQSLVLFGTALTDNLLSTILSSGVSEIIISLNKDQVNPKSGIAPGIEGCNKIIKKLDKWFSNTKLRIVYSDKKDFGEMTKEEIINWAERNNIYHG